MAASTAVPPSRREDVVEVYHGTPVADPYRWLEDGDSPEVVEWVAAQNGRTRAVLEGDPARAGWHQRLVALMRRPVVQGVVRRADHLFCWERSPSAEQFVLTRRSADDPVAPAVVLIDPALRSADAASAIDWYEPSPGGDLVAVGVSDGGTEWSTLHVVRGDDGSVAGRRGDEIPNTRACSVAWEPDGSGFFYTRYPHGDQYHRTVHHHRLGTDWRDDAVAWAEHPDPQAWPSVELSRDGRWLLVSVNVGWSRVDVHVLDRSTGEWTTLIGGVDAITSLSFAADGRSLVGVTTLGARRGRVVRVPLEPPATAPEQWQTLVDERDDVITRLGVTARELVMVTQRDAVDTVWRLDDGGQLVDSAPVALGEAVSVGSLAVGVEHDEWFAVVDSFLGPPTLWRVSPEAAQPWSPDEAVGDRVALSVGRTSYQSADGTTVGLFLVHRADVVPSPDTPAILNGYGGFGISLGPAWQPRIAAWCEAGGLYAIAGLRGGSERGEEWHQAGARAHKQNVFDDFHAAADHLVAQGLTSRARLAVYGGSNGGLLVGVALTQRPELCSAVVCAVPLLDMIRFPQFLIARLWTSEYGDPDVPEEFAWLYAYSPYHRVREGTAYPATLIQTAEGDSRVDPMHARKMAAQLQWASSAQEQRPILLFQEGRAGHGVGKPVAKLADSVADALTFAGANVGLLP